MQVETFYDRVTSTFTYLVIDTETKSCAVIDSVLDYDQFSGNVTTTSADKLIEYIDVHGLQNQWILETHVHADHLTASHYLQEKIGGQIALGKGIKNVLSTWVPIFANEQDTPVGGSQFDVLFEEGRRFQIGELTVTVWQTPGHTPACVSYLIEDSVFVGDTLFSPKMGTARCDFPGGSATQLYHTIQRFYGLPDEIKLYLAHDYPAETEKAISCVTVGESKTTNKMIRANTSLEEFVHKREARDATLAVPKLLFPSVQTNLRSGQFGAAADNGQQYIKIPLNWAGR